MRIYLGMVTKTGIVRASVIRDTASILYRGHAGEDNPGNKPCPLPDITCRNKREKSRTACAFFLRIISDQVR